MYVGYELCDDFNINAKGRDESACELLKNVP